MKVTPETVVLVDCNCNEIQKIARAVRSAKVYTMVMPCSVPLERLQAEKPVGIIFCADNNDPELAAKAAGIAALDLPKIAVNGAASMFPGIPAVQLENATAVEPLVKFCFDQCGCTGKWTMENFIEEAVADIRAQVGDQTVILGLSGGVDSSVVAALIHKAIGKQLTCVFVNHGLLRKNEPENVQKIFTETFDMNLVYIDATDRFLDKLAGVDEPERKRKIIGKEFIEVFADAAREVNAPFLGQGTIYPDILESISFDGKPAIKSHHNVGGLPPDLKFKLVEPVERLFKDEVRQVGRLLGLPSIMLDRHPFPGPSLGVRHLGAISRDTLAVLREADAIVTEELMKSGWYAKTWQTFAIFVPVKTTGIRDGGRSYDNVIAIRSINSVDAVTAEVVELPWELLFTMSKRIVSEVKGVNRVVYDITPKPPATIEWE